MDDDATRVELGPLGRICIPVLQLVQGIHGNIFAHCVGTFHALVCICRKRRATLEHLAVWSHLYVAVVAQAFGNVTIYIVEPAAVLRHTILEMLVAAVGAHLRARSTIDAALVAGTEDVAEALQHSLCRAYLAAVDVDTGLAEDEALRLHVESSHEVLVHVHGAVAAPTVLASATAKDVAQDVAVEHVHLG